MMFVALIILLPFCEACPAQSSGRKSDPQPPNSIRNSDPPSTTRPFNPFPSGPIGPPRLPPTTSTTQKSKGKLTSFIERSVCVLTPPF